MTGDGWSDHPCEALSALIDGELPGGERAAVEEHLRACPVCRGLREDIEVLGRAVAAEAPPPVPADLAARIRGRLEETAPARRGGWWRTPWRAPMPAAAAAAVVVAALVWLAWPGGRPPGAPVPLGEVTAPVASAAPVPFDAPDASAPAAAPAPVPAPVPAPARRPAPAQAPVPTPAPAGAARDMAEPRMRRSTPSPDTAAGGSIQTPAAKPGEPESTWSRLDSAAERAESPARKESAKDATADLDRMATQGGFVEATVKQEPPARSVATAANAPPATAPSMPPAVEARPALAMSPSPVASPLLEAAPYIVRLLPDGSMSVRARDYQCVVPIAPEDARLLSTLGDAATTDAVARGPAPGPAATGSAAAAGTTAAAGTAPASAAAEPAPAILSPEARQAIVRLVRERYRAIIEERCGQLPR